MKFKDLWQVLRVQQWYKNLVVFLAIFFSGNLFSGVLLLQAVQGFFSLAFISSAGYIVNDFFDRGKDALHPEKKLRPLAAGKISTGGALLLAVLALLGGMGLAFPLGLSFVEVSAALFLLSLIYTFLLKRILFADILAIALLFVLRALAGAVAIRVHISPWLVLCPFFLSLFLSVGKRYSEVHLWEKKKTSLRYVLEGYTPSLMHSLMIISTLLLAVSYALYSFLSGHSGLLSSLPFALFVVFRFFYLISQGSVISRRPEFVLKDIPMLLGMLAWAGVVMVMLYG